MQQKIYILAVLLSLTSLAQNVTSGNLRGSGNFQDTADENLWTKEDTWWTTAGVGSLFGIIYAYGISILDKWTLKKSFIDGEKLRWLGYPALLAITGGFCAYGAANIWPADLDDPWPDIMVHGTLGPLVANSGMILVYLFSFSKERCENQE